MPFKFNKTNINNVIIVEPRKFKDSRGRLFETYLKDDFQANGINNTFIQDKVSISEKGVLRGLHFQKGDAAQAKLVRCSQGKIFDVVLDLRINSDTYLEYINFILTGENQEMMFIPRGCAHGYVILSESAQIHYKLDNHYAPKKESGIIWNDPQLDIDWPVVDPTLSPKDKALPTLQEAIDNEEIYNRDKL